MIHIRELREAKGITMKEAARLLGMPYTTYVNYEKGLREPTSEVLIQIADFYGTTIDVIVGRNIDSSALSKAPEARESGVGKFNENEIMFALSRGGEAEITEEMYEEVKSFARYIAQREADKKNK